MINKIHFGGHVRVRNRSAVQAFEIATHTHDQAVLAPFDHVDIDIDRTTKLRLTRKVSYSELFLPPVTLHNSDQRPKKTFYAKIVVHRIGGCDAC